MKRMGWVRRCPLNTGGLVWRAARGLRSTVSPSGCRLTVGLGIVIVAVSACASGSNSGVPSVPATSSVTGIGAAIPSARSESVGNAQTELADFITHQRAWVACMRQHNIDLPDPDRYGNVVTGKKKDTATMAAIEACKSFYVPVPKSVQEMQRPKLTSTQIAQMVALAKCMQTHGMPDYPDPGPDGYTPEDKERAIDETSAAWQRAHAACASVIPTPSTTGIPQG